MRSSLVSSRSVTSRLADARSAARISGPEIPADHLSRQVTRGSAAPRGEPVAGDNSQLRATAILLRPATVTTVLPRCSSTLHQLSAPSTPPRPVTPAAVAYGPQRNQRQLDPAVGADGRGQRQQLRSDCSDYRGVEGDGLRIHMWPAGAPRLGRDDQGHRSQPARHINQPPGAVVLLRLLSPLPAVPGGRNVIALGVACPCRV